MRFLLLTLVVISMVVASESNASESVYSPHRKFRCDCVVLDKTGMIINLLDCATGKSIKIKETPRWAEIHWSPVAAEFAVVDHWDGQASSIQIFRIDSLKDSLQVVEQYHSPGLTTLGVEWEIKAWSIKEGKVWIKRLQVLKPLDFNIKHHEKEVFCVPFD